MTSQEHDYATIAHVESLQHACANLTAIAFRHAIKAGANKAAILADLEMMSKLSGPNHVQAQLLAMVANQLRADRP